MLNMTAHKSRASKLITLLTVLTLFLSSVSRAEEAVWEYEMQPGDNIWKIAHELLTDWRSWQEVKQFNNVDNDRLMAAGTILKIPASMIQRRQASIQLIEVSGPVTLISGQEKYEQPLSKQALKVGDVIKTGSNASALLKFEDDTQILLNPKSEFVINQASIIGSNRNVININVLLKSGEAEVRANPIKASGSRFIIETPSAFATTRGTVYRVRASKNQTAAEVTQGKIDVTNTFGSTQVVQKFGTLTTKNTPPQKPIRLLAAPAVPTIKTIQYLPARLSWNKINGAVSYRSQLSDQKEFSRILLDNLAKPEKLNIPASLKDGKYWLRVRAADKEGLQGLESLQQFIVAARPFPPTIQSPRPKAPLYEGDITFVWTQPEEAKNYRFELSQEENFETLTESAQTLNDQETTITIPEPGAYFWRVTSINAQGKVGPAGHTNKITVRPTPATPDLKEPVTSETELGFSWKEDAASVSYQIQLANDKKFNDIIADKKVNEAEAAFEKPMSGTYYMRVRGFDNDDYAGSWSSVQKIKVPIDSYLPAIIWSAFAILIML